MFLKIMTQFPKTSQSALYFVRVFRWSMLFQVPVKYEIQSSMASLSNRSTRFEGLSEGKTQHSGLKYSETGFYISGQLLWRQLFHS